MYSLKGRKSRGRSIAISILLIVLLALGGAAVYVRNKYNNDLKAVSTDQTVSIVTIASGSSVNEVGLLLEQKGLIRSAWAFEWYVRSHNVRDKLQAGSYAFHPALSISDIVTMITTGKISTDLFTILPAQQLDQIQTAFVKAGFSVAEVEKAFTPAQYAENSALTDKPKEASLEGYLYPESFERTTTTTAETIVAASLAEMAKALTPEVRAGFARQGLTVHQGVTIASIVEKEVSSSADRQKVAQVFLKRLKMGMMLGSDVTAYYGADVAGLDHSVNSDTPYNTRLHTGLPPGPISNTSRSSLQAVADPAGTDYVYFLSGDDGVTYFARTLDEHDANIKNHCQKSCGL